jgi:hypothetical protein
MVIERKEIETIDTNICVTDLFNECNQLFKKYIYNLAIVTIQS